VLIRAKKKCSIKNSIGVSKNAGFYAAFESIEKALQKFTKNKLLAKT
jgi:hypothetical protein